MPKPDSLQSSLDLLVLKILSRRPRLHGYAMSAVRDTSGDVLHMEEAGWKQLAAEESRWEAVTSAVSRVQPCSKDGLNMSLWSRIANVLRGDRRNREIEEEFESHLEEAVAAVIRMKSGAPSDPFCGSVKKAGS